GEARFLRLPVRKSAGADGVIEAEALQQFGIVVDFAAVPEPRVEIEAVAPGLLQLWRGRQAVRAAIGRMKAGIALRQEGRLAVDFPAVGLGIGQRCERLQARWVRPVDLAIEPEAQRLEIHRRSISRSGWEGHVGIAELAVEVFKPRGP